VADLVTALEPTGMFERESRRGGHVVARVALVVVLAVIAFARPWSLIGCVAAGLLGVAWGLVGFIGHDAVHRTAARTARGNAIAGHVCLSIVNGLGFDTWREIHRAHHKHLQVEDRDPDLDFPRVLSMTPAAVAAKRGAWRWLGRYQAWYFWPLGLVYAHRLRLQGFARLRGRDAACVALHYIVWLVVPAFAVSPAAALATYAIASAALGVHLAVVFGVNHIGMRALAPGERVDPLARHFACTRNIASPPSLDFLFGGLNLHSAHHLFPGVPHRQLRRGHAALRAFCAKRGLPYHELTLSAAVVAVTRHLAAVAASRPYPCDTPAERSAGTSRSIPSERGCC
jgi:fatty acid desaturase